MKRMILNALAAAMLAGCGGGDPISTGGNGTIRGTVTDQDGATVANAAVTLSGNGQAARNASSGTDGKYTFSNVPPGAYTLTVTAPAGFSLGTRSTSAVTVTGGADASVAAFVLTRLPLVDGSISGVINDNAGNIVTNAVVSLTGNGQAARTATTNASGVFSFSGVPPGTYTVAVAAPAGFTAGPSATKSVTVSSGAQVNAAGLVLNRSDLGAWALRANLIQNNSEFTLAEANGKLYVMGGYPPSRVTTRTVQVYDVATNTWQLGPQLPAPNNHGMSASVGGKIYLIGGQLTADQEGYVNTVYELDPAVGTWVQKAPMPTARSGGVAVVHAGKIYVAGGRVPQGSDFAVYDPAADQWTALPPMPTQRNHISGVAINGKIHIVGGRLGNGLSPLKTTAHEVFDPQTNTWSTAAPMLSGRSGMNGVMAKGCYHVWGGEAPTGMTPQHEFYDPRNNTWTRLANMPIPIHGVVGSAYVGGFIWVTGGGTDIGGSSGTLLNQVYRPDASCE